MKKLQFGQNFLIEDKRRHGTEKIKAAYSKEEIYQQIENDLKSAVHMVNTTYGSEGKGRATVWTICD